MSYIDAFKAGFSEELTRLGLVVNMAHGCNNILITDVTWACWVSIEFEPDYVEVWLKKNPTVSTYTVNRYKYTYEDPALIANILTLIGEFIKL